MYMRLEINNIWYVHNNPNVSTKQLSTNFFNTGLYVLTKTLVIGVFTSRFHYAKIEQNKKLLLNILNSKQSNLNKSWYTD